MPDLTSASPPPLALNAVARSRLRHCLRAHPKIGEHVRKLTDISTLTKQQLLHLAQQLQLDVAQVIAPPPAPPAVNLDAAFTGAIDLELQLRFQGRTTKRQARWVYEHSPQWQHYHLGTQALMPAVGAWSTQLQVRTAPEREVHSKDSSGRWRKAIPQPEWVAVPELSAEGIISGELEAALEAELDRRCRAEDRARRQAAFGAARPRRGARRRPSDAPARKARRDGSAKAAPTARDGA